MAFASVVQRMILKSNDNEDNMLILCLKLTTLLDRKKHPMLREMNLGHFLVHKVWPIGTYNINVFTQQIILRFFFCQ
jgi:muramoyltetrapeptide carboxypeptidase LdcA involved in peptidoglycan recycling